MQPKAVYIEVIVEQALEVTLAMRKVIKSDKFKSIYNVIIYVSLQFKFS